MEITIKNVKFSEHFSQETNCFTADVFVDGKKIAYAQNDGRGGCTHVRSYEGQKDALIAALAFAKSLPSTKFEDIELEMDLEHVIDNLLTEWLIAKDAKKEAAKLKKDCLNCICIGSEEGYRLFFFNKMNNGKVVGKFTIDELMSREDGRRAIKNAIETNITEDKKLLNTNIDITKL